MAKAREVGVRTAIGLIDAQRWLFIAVLGLLILFVLSPIVLIFVNSFRTTWVGSHSSFGLQAWRTAVSEPGIQTSILNTIALLSARTLISFPIAIFIAWLLARTDLPGREWVEFIFWILCFMPSLAVTLGWILLLDSDSGLLNQFLARLVGAAKGPFDIYSFWGIVWVHLASTAIAFKVILLTPLFRHMDGALEDASLVCGATRWQTVRRILLPIMTPGAILVLLAAIIYGLQTFEIELILGTPIGFDVYSTKVYSLLRQEPPLFGAASALSTMMLLLIVPVLASQRSFLERRQYVTVTGRHSDRRTPLGRWKIPALILLLSTALLLTIVPAVTLLAGSFMKLLGYFQIQDPWTTAHWTNVFHDSIFIRSGLNTLKIGVGTAFASAIVCALVAYLSLRAPYRARWILDVVSWLPATMPGILVGVGLLTVFVGLPMFRPLYGTVALLIIATVITNMATGTQLIKSNILQIGAELEEVSRALGASWGTTFLRIVVPILSPVLLLVGAISFTRATQDISGTALLATFSSRPLSLLQLDYMASGQYESAAVIATLICLLSIAGTVVARLTLKKIAPENFR